ncbi:hypothetical protein FPOAC2_03721 [Fusarium poae]|uniref:hypothetical protein n=1 Tax=Fusarium poae TaxID=36050 RepID=UPI001CE99FE3|nr:hypothetical protein FPOAC1_003610 [Fusarium poae]KAG8677586.1 hypothetical protein FPOAC1_003610 [Fusarium poae]
MSDTAFEKEWLVTLRQTKPSEMQPDSVKAPGTPHKSDLRETKELRYGYATKIVEKIGRNAENFRLTTFETSTLLIVPMSCLEVGGLLDSTTKHRAELLWTLRDIANLVGHYVHGSNQDRRDNRTSSSDRPAETVHRPSPLGSSNQQQVADSAPETSHEDSCIFMPTAVGKVAHILPCSWSDSTASAGKTMVSLVGSRPFLSEETIDRLCTILCNSLDGSDRCWNKIRMNDQLCYEWPHALFGLKCLGIKPLDAQNAEVEIQFNWLKRRLGKPTDKILILGSNSMQEIVEEQIRFEDNNNPGPNAHIPITSGHVVTLAMSSDDAENCKSAIDLQWHLVQIAAMSGGAEYPDLLPVLKYFGA